MGSVESPVTPGMRESSNLWLHVVRWGRNHTTKGVPSTERRSGSCDCRTKWRVQREKGLEFQVLASLVFEATLFCAKGELLLSPLPPFLPLFLETNSCEGGVPFFRVIQHEGLEAFVRFCSAPNRAELHPFFWDPHF